MGNHHGKEVRNTYSCHMAISPPVHTSEIMESLSFEIGRKGRKKNLSTLPEYLLVLHVILATTGSRLPESSSMNLMENGGGGIFQWEEL